MSQRGLEAETLLGSIEGSRDPLVSVAIDNVAGAIVEDAAKVKTGQKVLIWFDEPGAELAKNIALKCHEKGSEVRYFLRDYEADAAALPGSSDDEIRHMFDSEEELMNWAENIIIVRNPENPEAMGKAPKDKVAIYLKRYEDVHSRRSDGTVDWTLFLWPTEYEAQKEGLPHKEYFQQVIEACNLQWKEVAAAQAILKAKLDPAKILEFYANEDDSDPTRQTHVSMSIEGMTFCNSTVDRNYPGSEVFSAPRLHSVNGQIFAEGEYLEDGHLMRNILFKIENGRIVEAHAEFGDEGLQEILNRDDKEPGFGSRYFGECALGTNSKLIRRFFNPLLNEKVGGSFHMAVGHCYTQTKYGDDEVTVDNDNTNKKTSLHWDVTILMHRKSNGSGGGRVVVDGELIQVDGRFINPALEILNPKKRRNLQEIC